MPEWIDFDKGQFWRGIAAVGVAAVAVVAIAICSAGSAIPVLVGAGVGALTSGGVSGAFGGTALTKKSMFMPNFATGFLGSVAGDLVRTGDFKDINLGAAIWSDFLSGALSCLGDGVQYDDLENITKFSNRISSCKTKGITNKYFKHALKKIVR